ncbi:hypothetical protein BFP97_19715 [Roseivirga sp. 4D4]|uniref:ATP-grasp domain-containing protein n=1 Tax=Roseivirga sp. 4D4 TaxID=1889784 RepID=UPI0008534B4C|nr:hypothetical protein [Roseivirga sp. 4D4]OEK03607.1 hypothetical protein BFP97_19715 [Roseivirga sp. 4D4]
MYLYDFVVLTDDHHVSPGQIDQYIQNVLDEDRLVMEALQAKGYRVSRKSWSDPEFDWSNTKAIIFRTTWDYFDRFEEWKSWLAHTSKLTQMINSYELIEWNMDKHYLGDLEKQGINIPPTRYIEIGEETSLAQLTSETGWKDCILKPCISGAARHTYKLNADNLNDHEAILQELIAKEAMMLQPFQKNIVEKGEVSLMVMGGTFTHAVLKVAKPGDFRVQDDFGGTVQLYDPSQEEIAFAEKVVKACDPQPTYARVDIIRDNNDQLALIELELIEPELWFRLYPKAARILAEKL